MKLTNLDYVQSILSSLGSDEVNSVSDTTESRQVLECLRTSYFNIIARAGLTEHDQLVQLDPSLDITTPVLMYVPDGISKIKWIKYFNNSTSPNVNTSTHGVNVDLVPNYNTVWTTSSVTSLAIGTGTKVFTVASDSLDITVGDFVVASYVSGSSNYMYGLVTDYTGFTLTISVTNVNGSGTYANWSISGGSAVAPVVGYQYVNIVPMKQFLDMTNTFNPSEDNIQSFTFTDASNGYPGDFTFYYRDDRQPTYCTVINDYYVIFDSFDASLDSTLQSSKTMAEGTVVPAWSTTDSFIPNIDESQVPLLLAEAKSLAFFELKQSAHPIAERDARRQWSSVQRDKSVVDRPTYFDALPNFGRNSYGNVSYFKTMGWDR